MNLALLGIILFPLLGALLNLALFRREGISRRVIAGVGSAAAALAFGATLISLVQRKAAGELHVIISKFDVGASSFQLGLLGDRLSLWFAFVVTGVGLLIHLFSAWYMAEDTSFRRYFAKLNYFIFAMSVLVLADGFIGLLFGWANVGFASYSLIGFWREKPEASAAAVKAFVTNFIGEIGLFFGIFAIFQHFGSLTYSEVFARAADVAARHPEALTAAALLLLVGAAAKSAQLPLHVWLPDAMQGPTAVSALIHAATMVTAGVYLAARAYPIWQYSETAMMALATVGALSALFGAAVAIGQNDIKRVLAFSTMSQIGYMMLGAGVGAYIPSLFHFFTHAFFKALLFLVAGVIIHNLSGEQDMRRMGGLAQRMPFVWKLFLIGTLALAGIPPLAGFFSKDEILTQVLLAGHPFLFTIGLIAAGLTAFYSARLISLVFLGDPSPNAAYAVQPSRRRRRDAEAGTGAVASLEHDLPWYARVPLLLLAVASVVAGLIAIPGLPNLPERFLGGYFAEYAASAAPHGFSLLALVLSLVVAVGGGWLGWNLYRPGGKLREKAQDARVKPSGALANAFWFDDIYGLLFVESAQGFSEFIGNTVDPKGVDGLVNGIGRLTGALGGVVRRLQTGYLRRYTLAMFAGLVVVIAYYAWSALAW